MVKNVLCWLIFGSSSWSSIATGDSIQTGWRNIAKTIISKIVNTKFSLEGQKPLLQLSPRCFNVAENQCIQCNYQSQANMPQTRKLLKTHQSEYCNVARKILHVNNLALGASTLLRINVFSATILPEAYLPDFDSCTKYTDFQQCWCNGGIVEAGASVLPDWNC